MNKKIVTIFAVVVFVVLALLFLRFVIGGAEDEWICDNGNWVKHGHPDVPAPEEPCN